MLALAFDTTVNVGNIVAILTGAVLLARAVYSIASRFVDRVALTEEMVDEHTDLLKPMAGKRAADLRYVGERRHRTRRTVDLSS